MTDNEIIKALECCGKVTNCQVDCSRFNDCILIHIHEVIDFIDRQKAELERLKEERKQYIEPFIHTIRTEARREFAERLKEVFTTIDRIFECWEIEEHIDNLLKEMGKENE